MRHWSLLLSSKLNFSSWCLYRHLMTGRIWRDNMRARFRPPRRVKLETGTERSGNRRRVAPREPYPSRPFGFIAFLPRTSFAYCSIEISFSRLLPLLKPCAGTCVVNKRPPVALSFATLIVGFTSQMSVVDIFILCHANKAERRQKQLSDMKCRRVCS